MNSHPSCPHPAMLACWNIRGLNGPTSLLAVTKLITLFSLNLIGLLETKVSSSKLPHISSQINPSWSSISNSSLSSPCWILVMWNPSAFRLVSHNITSQTISCTFTNLSDDTTLKTTFVYGRSTPSERTHLWNTLLHDSVDNSHIPWVVLGDFNAILKSSDRVGGSTDWPPHMDDFGNCLRDSQLSVMPFKGLKFTWHNGHRDNTLILRKIDWILSNAAWTIYHPNSFAEFLPRDHSDHSPIVVHIGASSRTHKSNFKFLNHWSDHDSFLKIVQDSWDIPIMGSPMYILTQKLNRLKSSLKQFNATFFSNLSVRVKNARNSWHMAQANLDKNPLDASSISREREAASSFFNLSKAEEAHYKQRSKIHWLNLGDANTSFFLQIFAPQELQE